jgi:predicted ribosomally synthesized peptide with nif11-like leader
MSIKVIKAFSEKAKTDPEVKEKLLACERIKELLTLAKEQGFEIDEDELYPPNEPQFTADQLSARMGKALLRV